MYAQCIKLNVRNRYSGTEIAKHAMVVVSHLCFYKYTITFWNIESFVSKKIRCMLHIIPRDCAWFEKSRSVPLLLFRFGEWYIRLQNVCAVIKVQREFLKVSRQIGKLFSNRLCCSHVTSVAGVCTSLHPRTWQGLNWAGSHSTPLLVMSTRWLIGTWNLDVKTKRWHSR